VQIVATATLAAFIGAGGYGDYIVDGLNVFNYPELIAGALAVAILAIIVELLLSWLQQVVTPAGLKVQAQTTTARA
jgi:osmoprotectant transport system permease protein